MPAKKQMTVSQLIAYHKLNKPYLAKRMGMPIGTFKNKVYDSLPAYHLTLDEEVKLMGILREMAVDINNLKSEQ